MRLAVTRGVSVFGLAAAVAAFGCSATGDGSVLNSGGPSSGSGGASSSGTGGGFAVGVGGSSSGTTPSTIGTLNGTVLAPEGTIPIFGALVYLTNVMPEPIPDGVYCDRCVELDPGIPHVESGVDGSFALPAYNTGNQFLVVQKGQFRRVRGITVVEGEQSVPTLDTTFPGAMDKANGDDIPKMAIVMGQYDEISASLDKLGMQPGSYQNFDYGFPPNSSDPNGPDAILHDPARMNDFHIVFTPCDSSGGIDCGSSPAQDSATQSTLQQFAAAGGKVYVTDYSYDYIRQSWPEYIDWEGQDSSFGSACMPSSYDAPATVQDPDMSAWLKVQGIPSFTLEANWTMINALNTVATTDYEGNAANVTPKTWVSGQTPSNGLRPATVSFERGCGRVLFSTYHTEGSGGSTLLAQEKALLYVLLEVGVCIGVPVPN